MGSRPLTAPPDHRERGLAAVAAAATGVLVGSGIVATRVVVDQAGPASLAFLRYLIAVSCLLPFALASAQAALIFATMPLLTMLLAAALGRERLTAAKAAGVLLTIAGVGFALGENALERGAGPGAWAGELAAFASAASGAICSVLYRPYLRKYPTLPVSAYAMLAAVVFLAVLADGEGFFTGPPQFTTGGWLAIAFIGANSGIGYYLWLWALGHTDPTRVTVFLALGPVTAAALGEWILGEPVSGLLGVGLVCVAVGLALSTGSRRRAAPAGAGS